jgi:hypothetical protein
MEAQVMSTAELFRNLPKDDPLGFGMGSTFRPEKVKDFLELKKTEVSHLADVSVNSVRYDAGIPDAVRGVYQVRLVFHHDAGTITVSSNQFFYAVPVHVVVNGQDRVEWKLLGQEDIAG